MKAILFFMFLLLLQFPARTQNIDATFPQLNPGGVVNAMVEDTVTGILYIAGNFTSVNGVARRNIAAIQLSNNTLIATFQPVTAMTGSVNALVKYANYIYVGGSFTSVNGNATYRYFRRFTLGGGGTTATIDNSWNPNPDAKINDLCLDGSLLYVAGDGLVVDDLFSGEVRLRLACINASNGSYLNFDPANRLANALFDWGNFQAVKLHCTPTRLYVCGRNFGGAYNEGIIALNKTNGDVIPSFNPSFTFENVIDCETYNGKIYILNSKIWPNGFSLMEFDESSSVMTPGAFLIQGNGTPESIIRYKNNLFVSGSFEEAQGIPRFYLAKINLTNFQLSNWNPQPNSGLSNSKALHRSRNYLYISSSELTSIAGGNKNGIARFCLEPYNSNPITISENNICPLQQGVVAFIPPVLYATSYEWFYSGQGLNWSGNTNFITINANYNATNGILSVVPYNSCNLYSDTISIPITIKVAPLLDAGEDTTLTCIRDTVLLFGYSGVTNVSAKWISPSLNIFSGFSYPATETGSHVFSIYDSLSTCLNYDTLVISIDSVKPQLQLPLGTFQLNCLDTTVYLFGNTSTPLTDLYWRKLGGTTYPDPFICSEIGQYYLVGVNLVNGCRDSSYLVVSQNSLAPDVFLITHDESLFYIDTLTCNKNEISIIGASSANNVSYEWIYNSLNISNQEQVNVLNPGLYTLKALDSTNFCSSQLYVYVQSNLIFPSVPLISDSLFITCSIDSVLLQVSEFLGSTYYWVVNFDTLSNTTFYNDTGLVYLFVQRVDNGCVSSDSLYISFKPEINFKNLADTTICSGMNLVFKPEVIGSFSNLTYYFPDWSISSDSISVSISESEFIIVEVFGDNCYGKDSLFIYVPSSPSDSIIGYLSCVPNAGDGYVYVFLNGGSSPFSYSIDGGINYQNTPLFDSLVFGHYTFTIQDSASCLHQYSFLFDDQGMIPESNFYVASNAMNSDTIVIVNMNFPIQDSLLWEHDILLSYIFSDEQNLWLMAIDSGMAYVKLISWFYGCKTEKTKWIYFNERDTLNANWNSNTGIISKELYPNPNNGQFFYNCLLEGKQNVSLKVISLDGYIYDQHFFDNTNVIQKSFNLQGLNPGTYAVILTGEFFYTYDFFIITY